MKADTNTTTANAGSKMVMGRECERGDALILEHVTPPQMPAQKRPELSFGGFQIIKTNPSFHYGLVINPDSPNYWEEVNDFERRLARAEQVHTCKVRRCLTLDKYGDPKCKRKAPFKCATEDFVTETGEWGSKRLYPYMN